MIEIRVPTSKSVTQRALVLGALAPGPSRVIDPLDCDDSRVLVKVLRALGVTVRVGEQSLALHGEGTFRAPGGPLHLGNAGTATRFTTGLTLLADGPVPLDGDPALQRRPMPGLLSALRDLGAEVSEQGRPSCPPITVTPPADLREIPGEVTLDASGSSQQLSALLMVGPRLPRGLRIRLVGDLPSKPYVELTLQVLRAFGATVQVLEDPRDGAPVYHVARGGLLGRDYEVEGDHSSASYPLAAGFLTDTEVRVVNTRADSLQGDKVFPDLLARLRKPGDRAFDLVNTPDIAPTVATCALFAEGTTTLLGLEHLRIKESDRVAVLSDAFRAVGADLDERSDGLVIRPRPLHGDVTLDPERDHRMAMCYGLLGLRLPNIRIADRDCVTKSYPGYFDMLRQFESYSSSRSG